MNSPGLITMLNTRIAATTVWIAVEGVSCLLR